MKILILLCCSSQVRVNYSRQSVPPVISCSACMQTFNWDVPLLKARNWNVEDLIYRRVISKKDCELEWLHFHCTACRRILSKILCTCSEPREIQVYISVHPSVFRCISVVHHFASSNFPREREMRFIESIVEGRREGRGKEGDYKRSFGNERKYFFCPMFQFVVPNTIDVFFFVWR